MKKFSYLLFSVLLILLLISSCNEEVTYSGDTKLTLYFEGAGSNKHIEAGFTSVTGAVYNISGNGPDNKNVSKSVSAADTASVEFSGLSCGQWSFTVSLCTRNGTAIMKGSETAVLSEGNNELTVNLYESEGTGSLSINISVAGLSVIPSGMKVKSALTDSSGNTINIISYLSDSGTATLSRSNLKNGYYDLNMSLYDISGQRVGGAQETVRILSSMTSQGSVKIAVTGQESSSAGQAALLMSCKSIREKSRTFTLDKSGSRLSPVFDEDIDTLALSGCSYAWFENGVKIKGASSISYNLSRTSGRWRYDLVITFSDGSRTSAGINIQFQ
ncbi:MAG: hypothetical protein K6F82_01860 [Sphaerochaetaceae bacterium]|nr:hypothetical protein [Sphaerochaetaceae bacterium]